jgi:AcrR family transcriptional regulator
MKTDNTRDRILTAARTLFDKEGEAGLSMRRIAGAVGVTPMALYKHFADKDALRNALMADGFAAWEARVAAIKMRDPLKWLDAMGAAFLDFALEEPRRYEAAFLMRASQARRYPQDFADGRSPAMANAYVRIEAARAAGYFAAKVSALDIGLAFAALAQGLVSMYQAGRFASETDFRTAYRRAMRHCLSSYSKGSPS